MLSKHEDSATAQIAKRLLAGKLCPLYNDEILAEYREVLHRDKFKFSEDSIQTLISSVMTYGISAERVHTDEPLPDPKDVVFYEVSLSEPTSFLVTGNLKHFPVKPQIVSPAEMLRIMDGEK